MNTPEGEQLAAVSDAGVRIMSTLVEHGREDLVRAVRLTFQELVADRFKQAVAEAMGRRVVTYHSQVTFNPPMAFEIFVLEPQEAEG